MADLTLVLEASTGTGSVALISGSAVVADASVAMRARDGERLMPAVVELLRAAARSTTDIGRVVCSAGPGGFTGLRIAGAIGKGLAEALGIPLWSVSPLALLAAGAGVRGATDVLSILDAMRDEWYVRHFVREARDAGALSARGETLRLTRGELEAFASATGVGRGTGATIVGPGAGSFHGGVESTPMARDMVVLSEGELLHPVELASWEPDYGRLAEAQVKWEAAPGRALGQAG